MGICVSRQSRQSRQFNQKRVSEILNNQSTPAYISLDSEEQRDIMQDYKMNRSDSAMSEMGNKGKNNYLSEDKKNINALMKKAALNLNFPMMNHLMNQNADPVKLCKAEVKDMIKGLDFYKKMKIFENNNLMKFDEKTREYIIEHLILPMDSYSMANLFYIIPNMKVLDNLYKASENSDIQLRTDIFYWFILFYINVSRNLYIEPTSFKVNKFHFANNIQNILSKFIKSGIDMNANEGKFIWEVVKNDNTSLLRKLLIFLVSQKTFDPSTKYAKQSLNYILAHKDCPEFLDKFIVNSK